MVIIQKMSNIRQLFISCFIKEIFTKYCTFQEVHGILLDLKLISVNMTQM